MYINGQTGAVQERVAVCKRPPHLLSGSAWYRDPVPAVSSDHCMGPLCEVPIVITDWPISDHMIVKSVNDHRGHMVQGYSQQPCTI
ncbi:unnamed protein product [Staurois parvus]|uniref:Uncharacterized protein n=1 Tax=Staurois parvus TaxID=386267 RepID=A0ABN9G8Z6_9NEOB|nr:unnamed protein product [Staurois parvus]